MDDGEQQAESNGPPLRGAWSGWRSWMPKAVFEAGLIVFGLLLTLAITSWQDERRLESDVAKTRAALIAELQTNRDMLRSDGILPHHARLQAAMREAVTTATTTQELQEASNALFRDGIHFPQFRDAAWRTASASGILQHMERDAVFALTDAYGAQDRLNTMVMAYYPSALALPTTPPDAEATRGALMSVGLFLGDLYGGEQMTVRLQTEALVAMGAEAAAAEATVQPS